MKIKDFSEEKGLTKQAVYKAINRAGFSAKDLTDKAGNLNPKGVALLRKLFPDDQEPKAKPEPAEQDSSKQILLDRINSLEAEVKEWKERYFDLVKNADAEREQLRILIDQEQKLRAAAEHKGFLRRLFAGKKQTGD